MIAAESLWRLYDGQKDLQRALRRWRPVNALALVEQSDWACVTAAHAGEGSVTVSIWGRVGEEGMPAVVEHGFLASEMTVLERDLLLGFVKEAHPVDTNSHQVKIKSGMVRTLVGMILRSPA